MADISITNQSDLGKELKNRLDQLLISPDSNTMKNTVISGAKVYRDDSGLPVPFGFNKNPLVYKFGVAKKTSGITDPSQILYMTLGYDRFDENAGKAYAPLPTDGTPKPIYFLENQNALGSFIDGHVEVLKAPIQSRKIQITLVAGFAPIP